MQPFKASFFSTKFNNKSNFTNASKRISSKFFLWILLLSLFVPGISVKAEKSNPIEERLEQQRAMAIQSNEIPNWPVGPVVSAESAILIEAETGAVLYAKNIHQQEYPASTTKIMTTLLAVENCKLDEIVSFSHDAVFDNPPGSSGIAMDVGQKLTLEQCLNAILIRSANEVCFAVAEHMTGTTDWSVFAEIMNKRAIELGALNTHFANPNGLPDENHYTTAYDLAMIGRGFFSSELLCSISLSKRLEIPASENTIPVTKIENNAMAIIPGGTHAYKYIVGCKTGYTNDARSCLVSCAEKDGMRLICVVMKDESPLQYEDTISLFDYGFSNFDKINVSQSEQKYNIEGSGNFYDGNDIFGSSKPLLTLDKDDFVVLPKTLAFRDLTSTISYDTPSDQQAAIITYSYKGACLGTVRVNFAMNESNSYQFEEVDVNQAETPSSESKVFFINIVKILIVLAIFAAVLVVVFIIKAILKNYQFSSRSHRRNWKRNNRRRKRAARKRAGYRNRDLDF